MGSLTAFAIVYLIGGVSFIPLVLVLILLHAHLTFPTRSASEGASSIDANYVDVLTRPGDDAASLRSNTDELADKFKRAHEFDAGGGYFAVTREYVPGGVSSKPLERLTPAGEIVPVESPSVYQSMYRSIFDRKQTPTIEPNKGGAKTAKRARNVFYIVLRHGVLMLYDDQEQLEVRHVISLAHHYVDIYGGGDPIPEGELWIKRNAIRLTRREGAAPESRAGSMPFYLFSENCSDKEDFYFALLKNQEKMVDLEKKSPTPQLFDAKNAITLVQRLHSSEENLQTRWLNAIMGRLFLAMYKTKHIETVLRAKITKKISRVQKPNFISRIVLNKVSTGEGAPFILNPRLKDLTVDGDCCIEADIKYTGNFAVEIAATARIDLGSRFKAREVDLVLALVVKKLEGHMLLRLKPPPSNRLWISFETMPTLDLAIEPIVSSRQITYNVVLRAIESRIREVMQETVVQPFWDDIPFLDTVGQDFRGGIWEPTKNHAAPPNQQQATPIPDQEGADEMEAAAEISHDPSATTEPLKPLKTKDDRTMSMPELPHSSTLPATLRARKSNKSLHPPPEELESGSTTPSIATATGSTTALDSSSNAAAGAGTQSPSRSNPLKVLRSYSFTSVADPIVTSDNAAVDASSPAVEGSATSHATSSMMEIKSRSSYSSPVVTPVGSPPKDDNELENENEKSGFAAAAAAVVEAAKKRSSTSSSKSTKSGFGFGGRQRNSVASLDSGVGIGSAGNGGGENESPGSITPSTPTDANSISGPGTGGASTPTTASSIHSTATTTKDPSQTHKSASSFSSLARSFTTASTTSTAPSVSSTETTTNSSQTKRQSLQTLTSNAATAAVAAKKWSLGVLSKKDAKNGLGTGAAGTKDDDPDRPGTPNRPLGRGQPIPGMYTAASTAPSTSSVAAAAAAAASNSNSNSSFNTDGPPPLPQRSGTISSSADNKTQDSDGVAVPKRKPLPIPTLAAPSWANLKGVGGAAKKEPPPLPARNGANANENGNMIPDAEKEIEAVKERRPVPKPPLPKRDLPVSKKEGAVGSDNGAGEGEGEMLIVEAPPADSEPGTPGLNTENDEEKKLGFIPSPASTSTSNTDPDIMPSAEASESTSTILPTSKKEPPPLPPKKKSSTSSLSPSIKSSSGRSPSAALTPGSIWTEEAEEEALLSRGVWGGGSGAGRKGSGSGSLT